MPDWEGEFDDEISKFCTTEQSSYGELFQHSERYTVHTKQEDYPWWIIDLEDLYTLREIKIFAAYAKPTISGKIDIFISRDKTHWEYAVNKVRNIGGVHDGKPYTWQAKGRKSRFIKIQLRSFGELLFDHIQVFGKRALDFDAKTMLAAVKKSSSIISSVPKQTNKQYKSIAISAVKNEADIIETFIRHNLAYVDLFIICDNISTDNTLTILNNLKNEGLPIDLYTDTDKNYTQAARNKQMYVYAAKNYDFDFVFFLDADEFLCGDPSCLNTKYEKNSTMKLKRYDYIFQECIENNSSIFSRQQFRFGATTKKAMLVHDTLSYNEIQIGDGQHYIAKRINRDIIFCDDGDFPLHIAHFPIRSKEQFLIKFTFGFINRSLVRRTSPKHHWAKAFNFLKKHNFNVSEKDIFTFLYLKTTIEELKNLFFDPLPLTFSLKYQDLAHHQNLLTSLVDEYAKVKKEKIEKNELPIDSYTNSHSSAHGWVYFFSKSKKKAFSAIPSLVYISFVNNDAIFREMRVSLSPGVYHVDKFSFEAEKDRYKFRIKNDNGRYTSSLLKNSISFFFLFSE